MSRAWRVGLLAGLLLAIPAAAAEAEEVAEVVEEAKEEEDDSMSDGDGVEPDDYMVYMDGEDVEPGVRDHELGTDCIDFAEGLEREVGFFDNSEIGEQGRRAVAEKMSEHAKTLTGHSDQSKYHDALLQYLTELHTKFGSFGAADACHMLLAMNNDTSTAAGLVEDEEGVEQAVEDDGVDAADHMVYMEGEDVEPLVRDHHKGGECIRFAEGLEEEIGFFDNSDIGEDGRKAVADKMAEEAKLLTGQIDQTQYHDALLKYLTELHTKFGSFGAADACHLLFATHNEL